MAFPARPENALQERAIAPDLLARFAAIVGASNAITDPRDQQAYLVEGRGLYVGHSPMVLRPGSVDEVAAILTLAHATTTPIVPQGGNTGLVGGQTPHHGEIVLSLARLDRIREVDPTSNTMTCDAGVGPAFALERVRIHDALRHLLTGAEHAGLAEHLVHQRGLPVVDVGDDGDVADLQGATWVMVCAMRGAV